MNLLLSTGWRMKRRREKRKSQEGQAGQLINRSRRIADGAYPWVKPERERRRKMALVERKERDYGSQRSSSSRLGIGLSAGRGTDDYLI